MDGAITLDEARRREAEQEEAGSPLRSRALFWPELQKLPRPEYLVKGVLDADSLAEIFGPTSCGKSFLGIDPNDVNAHVIGKLCHHLIAFLITQQPVVDKYAGQLIADRLV